MNDFIMMPKKIILEKNYREKYGDKLAYILTELILSEDRKCKVKFSLEELISGAGLKPRGGKEGVNEEIKNLIESMINEGMIFANDSMDNIRITSLIKCRLGEIYDINTNGQKINWFALNINNYLKILDDKSKLSKFTLINIYFYISARIIKRNDDISNIRITGGMAEVFWDSQDFMCKELEISKRTLNTYLNYLRELKLICYGNIGRIVKDNRIREANNVYAIDEEELKDGLKQSLYYWENKGWKVTSK